MGDHNRRNTAVGRPRKGRPIADLDEPGLSMEYEYTFDAEVVPDGKAFADGEIRFRDSQFALFV